MNIGEIKVMGISYYLIKHFGLPLTYAYATLRQSVAGNSPFRGIVFCNLGTSKTNISKFVTTQLLLPHIFPHMVTPTMREGEEALCQIRRRQWQPRIVRGGSSWKDSFWSVPTSHLCLCVTVADL